VKKADYYDLIVKYDDEEITASPCYSCMYIEHAELSMNNVVVEGLKRNIQAGEKMDFEILLHDGNNNAIPVSEKYTISFSSNVHDIITSNTSCSIESNSFIEDDSNAYSFSFLLSRAEVFTFQIYINSVEILDSPFSINVYTGDPSYLSSMQMVSDISTIVPYSDVIVCIFQ
jgi:hypothetical protein